MAELNITPVSLKCKICGGDIVNNYLAGTSYCANCGNRWSITDLYPDYAKYQRIIANITKANDIVDLHDKLDDTVCAVMIEYVQGEGGVMALDQAFVDEIRKICDEKDILMVADEVQTGIGRTGKLLAGEHYGVQADVTTCAKGIGGGLPIGVCLANKKCADVLGKGSHGSTFGGNPVVCAGAVKVLEALGAPGVMEDIAKKAEWIRAELAKCSEVEAVTGLGFMIGIQLKTKKAPDVLKACLEKGLLVLTAKEKVRLLPPLTITQAELETGAKILTDVLEA